MFISCLRTAEDGSIFPYSSPEQSSYVEVCCACGLGRLFDQTEWTLVICWDRSGLTPLLTR